MYIFWVPELENILRKRIESNRIKVRKREEKFISFVKGNDGSTRPRFTRNAEETVPCFSKRDGALRQLCENKWSLNFGVWHSAPVVHEVHSPRSDFHCLARLSPSKVYKHFLLIRTTLHYIRTPRKYPQT